MIAYLKFSVKLILPFIIPFLVMGIIQGMKFDINLWSDFSNRLYACIVTIFLIFTGVFSIDDK